jgi:hypothetical protein
MHVDQAGKYVQPSRVEFFGAAGKLGPNDSDFAILNCDVQGIAANHEIRHDTPALR